MLGQVKTGGFRLSMAILSLGAGRRGWQRYRWYLQTRSKTSSSTTTRVLRVGCLWQRWCELRWRPFPGSSCDGDEEYHFDEASEEVVGPRFADARPDDGDPLFVKVVEAKGSYAAGSAGSSGGLIQAASGS